MRALRRKALRDLWHLRGQALAIALVVASGVALFLTIMGAMESLEASRASYYERYRFADVFASVTRAPEPIAEALAEIGGVAQVETRVVAEVTVDVEGMREPAVARLVSIPEGRRPRLNDLHVRSGRLVEPGREGEIVVSEAFAVAHGLRPGDSLGAVINGRRRRLDIVGVGLSPEYVYQLRGGDMFPDDRRFGVFWMGRDALAAALDMRGAFNDVSLSLAAESSEPEVLARVDALLAPYGGRGAYGRAHQMSDMLLTGEFDQLRTSGVAVPIIFLGVAAFLLDVVIARVIAAQRTQIATLRAFGYSGAAIGGHYLEIALSIVLAGSALGAAGGLWLAGRLTEMYARFFRFPVLEPRLSASTIAVAVLVCVAAATAGVLGSVRRAASLAPAEAMMPEPPAVFRPTVLERLGLHRRLPSAWRMVLRNLERRPARAALSALGVAMAAAILIVGLFSGDAVAFMLDLQFRQSQREDATLVLTRPSGASAAMAIAELPGVLAVEPFRAVPVRLRAGHRSYATGLTGLSPRADLKRVLDREGRPAVIPPEGVVLTSDLARRLGVGVGDELTADVLEGKTGPRSVVVAGLCDELIGANAYMALDALNRLLGEGPTISGAAVAVDARVADDLYARLKHTPGIAGVSVREAAIRGFEKTFAESQGIMAAFEIAFAMLIAFAVVYNGARIALAERSRELASLRVIGFTRAEVSAMLLGELGAITAVGIPLGLVLGYGMVAALIAAISTEMFRLPLVIAPSSYAEAALVVLGSAVASALVVRRRLDRLDLVGVLKTRD